MTMERREFDFLDGYVAVMQQSVSEAYDVLESARYCMAPWYILAPYLFEQEKVNTGRVQPLLEVMGASPASIYLAASGAYREAISMLRPLMEMVLVEWYYEGVAKNDPKKCEKFAFLHVEQGFDPQKGIPNINHKELFGLDDVKDYCRFIESRASDEQACDRLLEHVDTDKVTELRRLLSTYVHAHPASYNIVRGVVEPTQPFNREELQWWLEIFRAVHEAVVLWVQFIYPIMIWSTLTLSSQFSWLNSSGGHRMDVYWADMLHPLQREFFSKGLG